MSTSYDDPRVWLSISLHLKDSLLVRLASALECLVCSETMHVPFLAACGHSFCYGCLDAWFDTKINCPTCRATMDEPPILNIQLKDMSAALTDVVIDTLEAGATKLELVEARKRALDEYEQASRSKELFRGAFKTAPTLIDRSDGVPRCANCHWEAHGSECLNCGATFRVPRGDLYYDSEDGDAYNEDEDEVETYGISNADYDSEDSFVDGRDLMEINADRHHLDNDELLSSGDNEPDSGDNGSWEGFRQEGEMYRDDADDLPDWQNGGGDLSDTDSSQDMESAIEVLHERALQESRDYGSELELDSDVDMHRRPTLISSDEQDLDSGAVGSGRRTVHVIELDSE